MNLSGTTITRVSGNQAQVLTMQDIRDARPTPQEIKTTLLAWVDAEHTQYAQYRNYWDNWFPVGIAKAQKTKAGRGFEVGDVVLCSPDAHQPEDGPRKNTTFRTCYSARTGMNTSIPERNLVFAFGKGGR